MDFKELLLKERKEFFLKANGGISLPAAGVIYWLVIGIAGYFLPKETWTYVAFFASGTIFPLGMLLSKPLKANLMADSPLSGVAMPAMLAMFMSWPITIAVVYIDFELVPLTLAIGMALHWPVIGWMYNSKSCFMHAFARVVLVSAVWFVFPDVRFTLLPILVSVIYLVTIFGIKYEIRKLR